MGGSSGGNAVPTLAAAQGAALGGPLGAVMGAKLAGAKGTGGPLGALTGTAGGIAGTGIAGPGYANIQQGTSLGDVQGAQTGAANSLASQNALLSALQTQNGLGQQNAVAGQQNNLNSQLVQNNGAANQAAAQRNMNDVMASQKGFNNQLGAANGVGTQNQAISSLQGIAGQQAGTAAQYQNIANGTGPNPAQAALNQATGQNVANQAALMAGQRGAGANVGLMARQAAQQGAATQQQAVGQGATMQAQQQIAGLQGLAGQQQAMAGTQQAIGGLGTTQAGMQQAGINQQGQLVGQQGALAGQQVAAQQAQQQAMANQANQVAGQQIGATTANTQANLANQGQMQGSLAGINNANVSMQGNVNAANAGIANTSLQGQQKVVGGALSGLAGLAMGAEGGEVKKMAAGGYTAPQPMPQAPPANGPSSAFGQFLAGWGGGDSSVHPIQQADASLMQGKSPLADDPTKQKKPKDASSPMDYGSMEGGQSIGSPDTGQFNPDATNMSVGAADTGSFNPGASAGEALSSAPLAKGGLASAGGHVKAKASSQKAVKNGDSYDNDKVPAKLSEGEIVLPRSVTMSKDPIRASAAFVEKVLAKRGKK